MSIFVTGGGYIGSHTVIELLNAGHGVVVVDNFATVPSWHSSGSSTLPASRLISLRGMSVTARDWRLGGREQGVVGTRLAS